MKINKLIILVFLILSVSSIHAQKLGNIWYFGKYCGLTFNTPDGRPVALTDNRLQIWEGCATVSNDLGLVDFYTDGSNVMNRNHDYMTINAQYRQHLLNGCSSSSQSAIIVPVEGDSLKYYIFTTECFENRQRSRGINYSVVNMQDNAGLGNISPFNINLSQSSLEKITAASHRSGKAYWVVSHAYDSDEFYAFLVDDSGVQPPVISRVNPLVGDFNNSGDQGYMKITADGRKLAVAYTQFNNVYLYDFDNSTGVVSSPYKLFDSADEQSFYGVEFSPDGTKLYAAFFGFEKGIYQFDLSSNDINVIKNSAVLILDEKGFPPGALQMGPDGRIYVAKDISPYLHVINHPNRRYPDCDLQIDAVYLDTDNSGRRCHLGLPNAMPSIFFLKVNARATIPACEGDTVFLYADVDASSEGYSVRWTGPNGFTSNSKDTALFNAPKSATGWYYVTVDLNDKIVTDSVYLQISDSPFTEIEADGPASFCEGDSLKLSASPFNPTLFYSWSTGETTESIYVKKTGRYYLRVKNAGDCEYRDSIDITVVDKPEVNIIPSGPVNFCEGDSVILEISPYDSNVIYLWSTGEDTKTITVRKTGEYKVIARNITSCADSNSVNISVLPLPEAVILESEKVSICSGDSIELTVKPDGMSYIWSTGETTQTVLVDKPGLYSVIVENQNNCRDTARCEVSIYPDISVQIIGNTSICKGDSSLMTLTNKFYSYLWSTGETTESIYAKEEGWIKVSTIDSNGCYGADSIYFDVYEISVNSDDIQNIDFGRVFIDSDSTLTVSISNEDVSDFTIESIEFKSTNVFTHQSNLPVLVRSGDKYSLDIRFAPDDILNFKDSIVFNIVSPCSLRVTGYIRGTGIVVLNAFFPDTTGKIGETDFCIPVYSYFETKRQITDNSAWQMTISHDARIFLPDLFSNSPIINGRRQAELRGSSPVKTDLSVFTGYCGTVMLGDNDYSSLDILSMQYDNPNVIVRTIDGSLRTDGLCIRDLSRLATYDITTMTIEPNPVQDILKIDYYLAENGSLKIELIESITGISVPIYETISSKKGSGEIIFDVTPNSQGVYFVSLKLNSLIISRKLVIIK